MSKAAGEGARPTQALRRFDEAGQLSLPVAVQHHDFPFGIAEDEHVTVAEVGLLMASSSVMGRRATASSSGRDVFA